MKIDQLVLFIFCCLISSHVHAAILPNKLSINVGDVDADGEEEVLILKKRSIRSATHYQVFTWDKQNGYKKIKPPEVRTYRGYVQGDLGMLVNANIQADGNMNAFFSDGHSMNWSPVVIDSAAWRDRRDTH